MLRSCQDDNLQSTISAPPTAKQYLEIIYHQESDTEHNPQDFATHNYQLLENFQTAFLSVDLNWNCQFLNNSCANLLTINRAALLGKNLFRCFPILKSSQFKTEAENCIQSAKSRTFNEYYRGINKTLKITLHPLAAGLAIQLLEVKPEIKNEHNDIQYWSENFLSKSPCDLRILSFILSHHLRAPLSSAIGCANLLESLDKDDPDFDEILTGMQSSLYKMDEIIQEMNKSIAFYSKYAANNHQE